MSEQSITTPRRFAQSRTRQIRLQFAQIVTDAT
ncbi:unnamed protein product, partial [marine sediment metagenome]